MQGHTQRWCNTKDKLLLIPVFMLLSKYHTRAQAEKWITAADKSISIRYYHSEVWSVIVYTLRGLFISSTITLQVI